MEEELHHFRLHSLIAPCCLYHLSLLPLPLLLLFYPTHAKTFNFTLVAIDRLCLQGRVRLVPATLALNDAAQREDCFPLAFHRYGHHSSFSLFSWIRCGSIPSPPLSLRWRPVSLKIHFKTRKLSTEEKKEKSGVREREKRARGEDVSGR